jgi:hypothetical protein
MATTGCATLVQRRRRGLQDPKAAPSQYAGPAKAGLGPYWPQGAVHGTWLPRHLPDVYSDVYPGAQWRHDCFSKCS